MPIPPEGISFAPRLFTWFPASEKPTPNEDRHSGYVMLVSILNVGVHGGFYHAPDDQFFQHVERYDSFDDEPIEGFTREEEINNCLEWETEEIYPQGHPEAGWGNTITHWMLVPEPPSVNFVTD